MLDDIRGYLMMVLYSLVDTRVARAMLGSSLILVTTVVSLRLFGGYVNSPRPTIYITSPKAEIQVTDSKVLVQGKVSPQESLVTVNGQTVVANGDGTFSQIVNLTAGVNVLKFEAAHYGKKSGTIHTATRTLTEEEKAEQMATLLKEEQKVKKGAEEIATKLTAVDVLGAKTQPSSSATPIEPTPSPQSGIENYIAPQKDMILTSNEVPNGKEKIINGMFKNTTPQTLRWVKIKAGFKDSNGEVIDTKIGAVTQVDQHLAPGAEMEYTIPGTTSTYTDFQLSVAYEAL
ncbi:MAG: FxLYD domain-containing protein [bacterium]|nr:FxLYD domain-containing protein [bacterium]